MNLKKKFISIGIALAMTLIIALPVLADTWLAYYPTVIVDSSGANRTGLPVITGIEGQGLIDAGVLSESGMDSRMRIAGTDIPYMISETQIPVYISSLPAFGQVQADLFTTYNPDATDMDIITGEDGYITITDDATLELGNDFEIEQSGYVDTDTGSNKNLVYKQDAFKTGVTSTEEISSIIYYDEPVELIPDAFAAWRDVDVGDYVPDYATGIVVHMVNTAAAARNCGVRMNGSGDALVADLQDNGWSIVGIDGNDIFELQLAAADCHCYLVGFTGTDSTFKAAADDISLGVALAWTDIDISVEAPNATGAIIVILNTDGAALREWGVRQNLSGDNRHTDTMLSGISWAVVGCDNAQTFDGYVETLDVDFYLVGYTTDNVTFNTNADDISLGGIGAWTDIDCSGFTSADTTHIIVEVVSTGGFSYGLRRNGSVEDIYEGIDAHFWGIVECDVNQVIEGKISNVGVDFFIVGYVESYDYIDNPYQAVTTATGIASGEHSSIVTTLSGGTFSISVDGAVAPAAGYDETAFAGSVPDNANDWYLNQNNVMPWMDYYKHTVSGVEHAWYQPNYIVDATDSAGTETAGGSAVLITAAIITEGVDYWVGGLVTITGAGGAAPEGEARVCTASAVGNLTVAPAFSANVDIGDTFTVDFATLTDRSYYGIEFVPNDDVIACGAAANMDITDTATLTAWIYVDTDGENSEGSIIDRRDATPDGYRLYVSSEAAGNVAIEAILDAATDAYAVSNVEVSTGTWHYIVAVYNRLGTFHWEIYEDGVLLGLGTDQAGVLPITGHTANVMNIGDNAASNRCFDGMIDEPSFYTTAWTQALVTANYNGGLGLYTPTSTTSIALQLHMEEGSLAAVADTSGEANNGTITNAVWVNGFVPRPAGNSGTNDSRLTWGVNPNITLVYGEPVNYTATASGLSGEGGYNVAEADMPAEWYSTAGSMANLPLYDMMNGIATNTGIPCQTLYVFFIVGICLALAIAGFVMFNSVTWAIVGIGIGLGIGSSMTIIPIWILFAFLILAIGIIYLKGRAVFG